MKKNPPAAVENASQAIQYARANADVRASDGLPPLGRELLFFLACGVISVALFTCILPPMTLWPLAFICLAPWGVAVCRTRRAWLVHWGSFLIGWVFFLVNISWMKPVTGLGYVALAMYLGIYWTLAAWAMRTARRYRVSPTFSLPVAWVACEYLRGCVMSGFPWPFIAHAFYQQITLIQISDLTGAYGVSFLAVMVSGFLIDCWLSWASPNKSRRRIGRLVGAGVATGVALVAVIIYGRYRVGEAQFEDGPRIAVVQEDFPLRSTPPYSDPFEVVFSRYMVLAAQAAQQRPDIVALPETVWNFPQNIEFLELEKKAVDGVPAVAWSIGKLFHEATSALARGDYAAANRVIDWLEKSARPEVLARQPGGKLPRLPEGGGPPVTVLLGSVSIDVLRDAGPPRSKRYNSALLYDPDGVQRRERYNKTHLVPFGEVVPFRDANFLGISLHPVYRMLNRLVPFSNGGTEEFSLWPGREFRIFRVDAANRSWRFGVPICYEDVMPYVPRAFVWDGGERRADFLINISNDGWFLHSAELPQHLAICAFRAVENRVGIARAVNTGISGFIDPAGRTYDLVEHNGRTYGPGTIGFRIATVKIDKRQSFYGKHGDWFAVVCVICASVLWLGGIVTRWIYALQQRIAGRAQKAHRPGEIA